VDVIIFSYGEQSHPWLKERFVIETRVRESKEASKILGTRSLSFLGMREGHFEEDAAKKGVYDKLAKTIKNKKPRKILTHSIDDPHPDHKIVHNAVILSLKKSGHGCDVYTFDIWNPVNMKRSNPKLYVDISRTFKKKTDALKCFKSQKMSMISLLWSVYIRAIATGIANRTRFAEVFYKVR
jgi:LmbE family N-acetylglucosaminyl deacetylase